MKKIDNEMTKEEKFKYLKEFIDKEQKKQKNESISDEITDNKDFKKVYSRALYYLSISQKTEKQMKIKLLEKFEDIDNSIIDDVIIKLKSKSYINDIEYAQNFIKYKKFGEKKLRLELFKKGISSNDIDIAYKNLTDYDEDEKLEKAIEKNKNKEYIKLVHYLVRQGFDLNSIFSKLKELNIKNSQER